MQSCSNEFEMAVRETNGLTEFRPRFLPTWLRAKLLEGFRAASIGDEELVGWSLRPNSPTQGFWLCEWGTAMVNRNSVFVFTTNNQSDPETLATAWRFGVTLIPLSGRFGDRTHVGYFFEHGLRPMSDDLGETGLERLLATASAE